MYFAFSIFKILIDEFMLYSFKIVRNYSQALFSVAKSLSDAKKILEQISIFTSIFHESALVKKAICSPIIDMSIKGNLIDLVAKKCKFAKTSKQFLHILIKNKRFTLLPEIVNDLKIIIMESELLLKSLPSIIHNLTLLLNFVLILLIQLLIILNILSNL